MNYEPIITLITQTGIWCVSTFILAKLILDNMKSEKIEHKEDKNKLYDIYITQAKILQEQKELIKEQVSISKNNKEMLDKLTNIQMLHTNRLDKIEERLEDMEDELKKRG
ncbi:MAG: hypothetical protein HUJ68_14060 [Clostridia bacterium]|nr:hypothetical protein [Clostridia bacterium]